MHKKTKYNVLTRYLTYKTSIQNITTTITQRYAFTWKCDINS